MNTAHSLCMKISIPKLLLSTSLIPLVLSLSYPQEIRAEQQVSFQMSSSATTTNGNIPVYFGVGCFWHVQHEFVQAEKNILGRSDEQLTSTAGYAGGTKLGKSNAPNSKALDTVCYHNFQGIADYGKLGHGEVVGLQIPESSMLDFSTQYFSLFGSDLERPDKGDRGAEYRSLVGIPGGTSSPLYPSLERAASQKGLKLVPGKGDDVDTLGKKIVWVMDSDKFSFHPAELYHQFHDGFMPGESYPQSYNTLAKQAYDAGRLSFTGCPDTEPR
eukprot:CAMPEP_0182427134 /NCGR_PEP_ID=MMETSP1167-20130531/14948_1 /TAXON_ID=2988 /ORGANISM="Mallomonas Sp, Strain CCMP3275" /LENGTH=271 /DNA_ID=CAMNT_0024609109 /DNA_START=126 /DNA_END=941 /DNA_ORIENTATION=+